jgi:hypothetical protein
MKRINMIRKNDIIKHKNSMDVCFSVGAVYVGSTHFKVVGFWMNQGYVNSWGLLDRRVTIKIQKDKICDLLYTTDNVDCYRYADWKSYGS